MGCDKMTDSKFEKKLKKAKEKNEEFKQKQKLEKIKYKYKQKRKPLSTSKLVLLGAVVLCIQITLFCEYMMWKTTDLSSMYVLIGIVPSLSGVILGYYLKSKSENTVGGIIFETAMEELRRSGQNICDSHIDEDDEVAEG